VLHFLKQDLRKGSLHKTSAFNWL